MIPYSGYSEPLRSFMRRRLCAHIATVAIAGAVAMAASLVAITLGNLALKSALSLAIASPIPGCC